MSDTQTEQPPFTVVHVISGLGQGGAETVLYRLVTAPQAQTRHIVVSLGDMDIFGPRLQQAGIEVHALRMKGIRFLSGLYALRRLLKRLQPDVVQTWMYHADLLGGIVARSVGLRTVVWGIRNSGENLHHSSFKARAVAWLCARLSSWVPAAIVACAENAARRHKQWGYAADKMTVIPNGYDLSAWQPDPAQALAVRKALGVDEETALLLSVARWNPLKDHPNLLAALARLKRQTQPWVAVLVGEGMTTDNAELMQLIRHFELEEQVRLIGRREDIPAWMAAADIHILSSKAEGFPNVVCEAMVAQALCVVTDVGDAAKIVGDEGIVVPPRNAEALATGIEKALQQWRDPNLTQQLQAGSARIAAHYSLEKMVQTYQSLWRSLSSEAESVQAPTVSTTTGPILLYVVNNPAFFLSHRLPLAQAAQSAGFQVHVATMNGPAVARIKAQGFTHHVLPLSRSGKNPLKELHSLWALYRLFKRVRPQVVHAVTIKPVLYGGIAARLARVPGFLAAVSGLGYLFTDERDSAVKRIALFMYKLALGHPHSRVVFQNTSDRDVLLQAGVVRSEQAVMIRGSGVDLDQFSYQPEPDAPIVALMVARLLADKGVNEFIEAAKISQQQGESVIWQIAGSPDPGNPASLTREQMTDWHQAGVVQWLGEQTDIAGLYQRAHIAVLPSYREGLPKSLIEAAACGRAVVTTDVPGCRDAIEANVTGLLVPPKNAQAVADAVLELAHDTAKRQDFGRAGRDLAERAFDINYVIDSHLRLYGYLAKSRMHKRS